MMIKWTINYIVLGWLLNASELCLQEHDTNSDTDFGRWAQVPFIQGALQAN